MAQQGPPPPPPPPGQRGPVPPPNLRPPGPPIGHGAPGGQQPRPPPGFPPMNLPIRQQSSRIVDITPPKLLDETTCLKKLTTYAAFTIRKAPPVDSRDKPTWARSEVNDEKLAQDEIIKQIKKLNETSKPVAEKKAALFPNQGTQITNLLDDLASREPDRNFEWTLAQLDRREKVHRHGLRETVTMTVFFKRSPLKELNPVLLHQNIERARHERMMQQNRPPQQQGPPPAAQQQLPVQVVREPQKKASKSKLPILKKDDKRHSKQYYSSSSSGSYSDDDSDYYSGSDFGSSLNTSISSGRSRGDRKFKGKDRVRSYTRQRPPREHRKMYYIENRGYSPERPQREHRYSVPDVPRNVPVAVPGFDPVAAAYQAGKIDADAERFSIERERELERLDRERYAPPQRPLIIDRPVVIERPLPVEPRAIVSYHRPEPRRFESLPIHYSDADFRYSDDRYADRRSPRDEEFLARRQRDAEDYIDRGRPNEFLERRRSEFDRPGSKVFYRDAHPFARRYPPPSESDGW